MAPSFATDRFAPERLAVDSELASLIDELYYEHHVRGSPMWPVWQSTFGSGPLPNQTLADSFAIFGRLRELGIRAHSWV